MGGSVGLHGTDGGTYMQAEHLGARPIAERRAKRTLDKLASSAVEMSLLVASGPMGEDISRQAGFEPSVVAVVNHPTTSADTAMAAGEMDTRGVDLILFAGGDGTTRDIVSAIERPVPVLGIPTGVKMHSAVFANTPEFAAEIVIRFIENPESVPLRQREVVDLGSQHVAPQLHAVASVPYAPGAVQAAKSAAVSRSDPALDALCFALADQLRDGGRAILGPGTSTNRILEFLDLEADPLAVKLVSEGGLLLPDATEAELLAVLDDARPTRLVLGVIGGQSFLLGRGNQQISSDEIATVGEDNVIVIASEDKIASLDPPVLRVDLGTEKPEIVMTGYKRVHTAPGRSVVMRVVQ